MIAWIIGIILELAYIFLVFKLGQKERTETWFYGLLIFQIILQSVFLPWKMFFNLLENVGMIMWLIAIVIIVERIIWVITLKEVSGKNRLVWFYLIFIFPLLGWLIYRGTETR